MQTGALGRSFERDGRVAENGVLVAFITCLKDIDWGFRERALGGIDSGMAQNEGVVVFIGRLETQIGLLGRSSGRHRRWDGPEWQNGDVVALMGCLENTEWFLGGIEGGMAQNGDVVIFIEKHRWSGGLGGIEWCLPPASARARRREFVLATRCSFDDQELQHSRAHGDHFEALLVRR